MKLEEYLKTVLKEISEMRKMGKIDISSIDVDVTLDEDLNICDKGSQKINFTILKDVD